MTRFSLLRGLAAAALTSVALAAVAGNVPDSHIHPVTLAPIHHNQATLTVIDANGQATAYTPDELEMLPTYALEARTPWGKAPAKYEGVLLADLLERHGLTGKAIEVTAENDFSVIIKPEVIATGAFLIATRVNGKAHTRRARGPIQFVVPDEAYTEGGPIVEADMVWMAARIRPAN